MSMGMVICSKCKKEVHQWGRKGVRDGWIHCEDKSPRCEGATSDYPQSHNEVNGPWCGKDGTPPGFPKKRTACEEMLRILDIQRRAGNF